MAHDPAAADPVSRRVLVLAPVGRDAELTRDLLARASIRGDVCASVPEMCAALEEGAGALLMTEEALEDPQLPRLVALLREQPPWSDLGILLFAGSRNVEASSATMGAMETLRNVTLLDRPVRIAALLSAARAALRSRERQYELRDLLVALDGARADAEEANRLKDEFLATLSHELRTPLNAIVGWTTMLCNGQVSAERMPQVFQVIERNAQAQAQLIADVLDISRIITGKLQLQWALVDVSELVLRLVESHRPAAAAKGIELRAEIGEPALVSGDTDRLHQVFANLLSNAVKFTGDGGSVTVRVSRDEESVRVVVRDTGMGIPREFLPFVFDRFRQADQTTTRTHGGLGLGLAIVKHLTELHRGHVFVESQGRGHGATFLIVLPPAPVERVLAAPLQATSASPAAFALSRPATILVVDDDAGTRELLTSMLGLAGARVLAAAGGAEAREILEASQPDLVVADLGMPVENGFALVRHIRTTESPSTRRPVIALSAYADAATEEAALAAGFTSFLAKPARPLDLLHRINEALGRTAGRPVAAYSRGERDFRKS